MTDKEAIEILQGLKNLRLTATLDGRFVCAEIPDNYKDALENLLLSYEVLCNELDKKNKEIEELKESIHKERVLAEAQTSYDVNEMWKQKIQEKIDELENKKDIKDNGTYTFKEAIEGTITTLELLKGEDE